MSVTARVLLVIVAVAWVVLVAKLLEDPLGAIGVIVVSVAAATAAVLIFTVDAALRASRELRRQDPRA